MSKANLTKRYYVNKPRKKKFSLSKKIKRILRTRKNYRINFKVWKGKQKIFKKNILLSSEVRA
jgi:hypothetical protein